MNIGIRREDIQNYYMGIKRGQYNDEQGDKQLTSVT